MRLGRSRDDPEPEAEAKPQGAEKPPWAHHLDQEERPNREDLAADHNVFSDSVLSPVPLPRWLRGKRRQRDKLS
jgi:hypothetical protein